MSENIIYRYGTIMKEEQLVPVTEKVLPNTMVLETPEPFPGYLQYYHETPHDPRPMFIYLGLKDENHYEDIARATGYIHKKTDIGYSAAFGSVSVNYEQYRVLRLRYLKNFDEVLPLQQMFQEEGITFLKPLPVKGPMKGLIRLKKVFKLEVTGEGMYQAINEKKMGYFTLPQKVSWSEFEALVAKVRNNWNKELADFALGSLYHYEGIEDIVRVYSPAQRPELIKELKQVFSDKL